MGKSNWSADLTHSEIGFKIKHMMFTNVSGKFNAFIATIENEDDNFESSKINFTAETDSIDTNNPERDNHLRSDEFLDTGSYPKLSFVSTNITKKSQNDYEAEGELTIKEVTKNIKLGISYSGLMKDPWGNIKIGISVIGSIHRKDFGLTWNAALEAGGLLLGEEIKLASEVQFIKQ